MILNMIYIWGKAVRSPKRFPSKWSFGKYPPTKIVTFIILRLGGIQTSPQQASPLYFSWAFVFEHSLNLQEENWSTQEWNIFLSDKLSTSLASFEFVSCWCCFYYMSHWLISRWFQTPNARMLVVPASRVRERLINAHACCLLGRGRALRASCE